MKLYPTNTTVIIQNIISGLVNWLARTKVGVRLASIIRLVANQKPAVKLSPAASRLTVAQKPAVKLSQSSSRMTVPQKPAYNVTQIAFNLVHMSHIVTAANRVTSTQNWTNPANAQGAPNGVFATWGNPLSILSTGTLNGTMIAQPAPAAGRPASLVIDEIYLRFYSKATGLPLIDDLLSGSTVGFFINTAPVAGTDTVLLRHGLNYDNVATGEEFRIDNGAGAFIDTLGTAVTWANVSLIVPYFKGDAIVGVNPTISADACRLRVVAHEVWNP